MCLKQRGDLLHRHTETLTHRRRVLWARFYSNLTEVGSQPRVAKFQGISTGDLGNFMGILGIFWKPYSGDFTRNP